MNASPSPCDTTMLKNALGIKKTKDKTQWGFKIEKSIEDLMHIVAFQALS